VIYAFIETEKTNHRVSAMCRALKVSKSGSVVVDARGLLLRASEGLERTNRLLTRNPSTPGGYWAVDFGTAFGTLFGANQRRSTRSGGTVQKRTFLVHASSANKGD
jgi:hypothetical protein